MDEDVAAQKFAKDPIVNIMLNGGRVTSGFRAALFSAAGRAGVSVNEFVLAATAEKLRASGSEFSGVFVAGDLLNVNDNTTVAVVEPRAQSGELAKAVADAAFDQMCLDIGNAHRQPHRDS